MQFYVINLVLVHDRKTNWNVISILVLLITVSNSESNNDVNTAFPPRCAVIKQADTNNFTNFVLNTGIFY
jgi:hypothetical protein